MCFAPQWRALFEHLNFQKCSEKVCFVHFDLEMCFPPQQHALFHHLNFQKSSQTFFALLTSTCASRHNGVQVFISHLDRWLRTRRFSEPTRSHKSLDRTQSIATFLIFRKPASSFLWRFLFSDLLSSSLLFSSLTLPTSAFPSVHIAGKLTSKLPSINCMSNTWWRNHLSC